MTRRRPVRETSQRLPLAVYATLRTGEPIHHTLFGDGDIIAALPATIAGLRLYIADASTGHHAGFPIALPDPNAEPPLAAELFILHPDRHDTLLHRLRGYHFDGHDPLAAATTYAEHHTDAWVTPGQRTSGGPMRVRARIWLPARPMRTLADGGHITAIPGNDWTMRTAAQRIGGPQPPRGPPRLVALGDQFRHSSPPAVAPTAPARAAARTTDHPQGGNHPCTTRTSQPCSEPPRSSPAPAAPP